nr:hypothetical protein [Tanacetum cinerariifolium]
MVIDIGKPMNFTGGLEFMNLTYTVMKKKKSDEGKWEKQVADLLNKITGYASKGCITAVMGEASGWKGKNHLLLPSRKMGETKIEMLFSTIPPSPTPPPRRDKHSHDKGNYGKRVHLQTAGLSGQEKDFDHSVRSPWNNSNASPGYYTYSSEILAGTPTPHSSDYTVNEDDYRTPNNALDAAKYSHLDIGEAELVLAFVSGGGITWGHGPVIPGTLSYYECLLLSVSSKRRTFCVFTACFSFPERPFSNLGFILQYCCPSLTMSEEDQIVDVTALPKFDMQSYESKMAAKDVKSLDLHHGIPLDLHPVTLTEGWTMDKLPDDMIDRRVIPDAMAWRHHDSNINDPALEDGFSMQDMQALTERVINLRPVPSSLLCQGGLATTWDYPGFRPIFKDTEGNVVTMSEYLRFPFLSGASISKGPTLTSQDRVSQHTICPLSKGQNIPEKTNHQRRVEVEDPKIVATRERKARAATKKRERKKQGGDGGEAESREDRSPHESPRDSANRSVHNYFDDHHDEETDDLNLGSSGEQSGRALTLVNTEVIQPSPKCQRVNQCPIVDRVATPLRTATQGDNAEAGESSREGALYVPGWSIHRRCRVDNLMWGSLAQTDILKRFKNLQTDFDRLAESHAECGDLVGKLVQARLDLTYSSHLYTSLSDRHKTLKNEHEGCAGKLEGLENHNRELSQANRDQAQQKEKLVSQVGRAEMEKFECIRKLLPTMVERLLQSYEYKRSLSKPFNLAIQAGWGKGLAEERSEEDLLELIGRIEGFDVHVDTKMRAEYDKLFERRYPYVEKISHGFCHSVFDLLKVYPDSPPHKQVPPYKPSSEKALSTSAPPGS